MPKWNDEGKVLLLEVFFMNTSPPTEFYLGMFTNGTEPIAGASLSTITEPFASGGYARKVLSRNDDWTMGTNSISGSAETFTASGGDMGSVYGYFLADSIDDSGHLLAVEAFSDGPYYLSSGDYVIITPIINVTSI
jgi:hypothetical protein